MTGIPAKPGLKKAACGPISTPQTLGKKRGGGEINLIPTETLVNRDLSHFGGFLCPHFREKPPDLKINPSCRVCRNRIVCIRIRDKENPEQIKTVTEPEKVIIENPRDTKIRIISSYSFSWVRLHNIEDLKISLHCGYKDLPATLINAVTLEPSITWTDTAISAHTNLSARKEGSQTEGLTSEHPPTLSSTPRIHQTSSSPGSLPGLHNKLPPNQDNNVVDIYTRLRLPVIQDNGHINIGAITEQLPRIECNSCYLAEECPEYQDSQPCAFNILEDQFDVTTTVGLTALLDFLLHIDKTRTIRMILVERLTTGGLPDPKAGQQIDRLRDSVSRTLILKQQIQDMENPPDITTNELTVKVTDTRSNKEPSILGAIFGIGGQKMIDTTAEDVDE